jgi:cytochrome c553
MGVEMLGRWAAALALAAAASACSPAAAQVPAGRLALCAACHGADGQSRLAGVPSLAGQPRLFLESRLVMIREGLSEVPQMKGMLDALTDAELIELSRHYAVLPPPPAAGPRDPARAGRGAKVAERALCGSCHLPDQRGREQIPRLAGQREDYLLHSLRQFLAGQGVRGRDTAMIDALLGLSEVDLADLAHYLATMGTVAP